MESLNVETKDFVRLLSTLRVTAYPKPDDDLLYGICLVSTRGEVGELPGETDILSGFSSMGSVVGHTFCGSTGALLRPLFLSLDSVDVILGMWEAVARKIKPDDEHTLDVIIDRDASTVTVREYNVDGPSPSDRKQTVPCVDYTEFPVESIARLIDGTAGSDVIKDKDGNDLPVGALTMFNPEHLALLGKLGKKLKSEVRFYRSKHPASILQLSVGENWRGAVTAAKYEAFENPDDPKAEAALPVF